MDLLTAILACSVYAQDDALVRAIAQSNSHGNAFAVIDAAAAVESGEPPPAEPRTLVAAIARLEEVRSREGRPLLGWMQLPPEWVTMFGRELREAFDPCVNISIGTAMLSAFDYECSMTTPALPASRHRRASRGRRAVAPGVDRRACVVRKYGEAIGMPDFGLMTTLEVSHQLSFNAGSPMTSPIQTAWPEVSSWGGDCILVPAATDAPAWQTAPSSIPIPSDDERSVATRQAWRSNSGPSLSRTGPASIGHGTTPVR